jgi:serine/threonine protein kinase
MITEYVCGGDLLSFIRKRTKINEITAKFIFRQILEAMKFTHSQGIVHRDIKLDNILIDLSNNIKLCDFGVSSRIRTGELMFEHCGTPAYIAPEILLNKGYEASAVDVWSSGVVLYAMLCGRVPFKANKLEELHSLIINGNYDIISDISQDAMDCLSSILQTDPSKRLTIDAILNHPWMKADESLTKIKSKCKFNVLKFQLIYLQMQKKYYCQRLV